MRILHLTDTYGFTGGIQSYIKHVSSLLQARGHEVEIYSPHEERKDFHGHLTRWISFQDYSQIKKIIARRRPDIVHAHSISMRVSPLPCLAARQCGIPVVMTVHDFNYICPRKWMIYRDGRECRLGFGLHCLISNCRSSKNGRRYLLYHNLRWLKVSLHRWQLKKYVQEFISPSRILGNWMEKSLGLDHVIHMANFIPGMLSGNFDLPENRWILFVGRLSREKGVDTLLKALPVVLESIPEAFLTIVGDGPDKYRLEKLARELRISEKVNFVGMVDNARLSAYYLHAGVCVIPSLWMENCPVSALEALAFGRPLVGSNIGGIPELIEDGETGFICKPDDEIDLALRLSTLLGNDKLMHKFSRAARKRFLRHYTEEKHGEALINVYQKVLRASAVR